MSEGWMECPKCGGKGHYKMRGAIYDSPCFLKPAPAGEGLREAAREILKEERQEENGWLVLSPEEQATLRAALESKPSREARLIDAVGFIGRLAKGDETLDCNAPFRAIPVGAEVREACRTFLSKIEEPQP